VTSSYGWTPGVVKTRLTFRPLVLGVRRARVPDRRSSVSVMTWSSPWSVARGRAAAGEEPRICPALTCVVGGTVSSEVLTVLRCWQFSAAGRAAGSPAPRRRQVGLHARQRGGPGGVVPGPQVGDLLLEVVEGVEGAVDAGEAEVGHLV